MTAQFQEQCAQLLSISMAITNNRGEMVQPMGLPSSSTCHEVVYSFSKAYFVILLASALNRIFLSTLSSEMGRNCVRTSYSASFGIWISSTRHQSLWTSCLFHIACSSLHSSFSTFGHLLYSLYEMLFTPGALLALALLTLSFLYIFNPALYNFVNKGLSRYDIYIALFLLVYSPYVIILVAVYFSMLLMLFTFFL